MCVLFGHIRQGCPGKTPGCCMAALDPTWMFHGSSMDALDPAWMLSIRHDSWMLWQSELAWVFCCFFEAPACMWWTRHGCCACQDELASLFLLLSIHFLSQHFQALATLQGCPEKHQVVVWQLAWVLWIPHGCYGRMNWHGCSAVLSRHQLAWGGPRMDAVHARMNWLVFLFLAMHFLSQRLQALATLPAACALPANLSAASMLPAAFSAAGV